MSKIVAKKKIIALVIVIGIALFVASQYVLASKIGVTVSQSELLQSDSTGALHSLTLEFNNPSLLILTAGQTEFAIITNTETVGSGTLESFTLSPLGKSSTSGKYHTDKEVNSDKIHEVKITGTTKYNLMFTTIEVPFVYYPTEEQAREFIRQN